MRITTVFSAAFMATSINALHVQLVRYSQPGCPAKMTIGKSTDMHDTTCKTFHHHDAGIESFNVTATREKDDLYWKKCKMFIYDQADCKGNAFVMDDLKTGGCGTNVMKLVGRSAKLECLEAKSRKTSHHPVTHTVHVPDFHTIVVTPSADPSGPKSTKTIWLDAKPTGKCNCVDGNDD